MKSAVWRASALLCIALAIAFIGYQLTLPERDDFGLTVRPIATGRVLVTAVDPHSPAALAGIRAGDSIWYGNTLLESAAALFPTPGSRVPLLVNGTRAVTLTARSTPAVYKDFPWIAAAIRLAFLLVAALLAWRRPEDRAARPLVVFLACYGLLISLANGVMPVPLLSVAVFVMGQSALFAIGTAAAAFFAARFPSGVARAAPQALARVALALGVLALALEVGATWLPRTPALISNLTAVVFTAWILIGLVVAATLVTAYVQGAPSERQRRRWVFLIVGVGLCGPLIDVATLALFGYNVIVDQLMLLPLALLPFGLAYVILRHRVIDVGFVINRAVVYTGVSVIVVGVFVVVETLLAKYVQNASHVTSTAVELAVALGLGFSIRYVHARVDHFVDTVIFRERHLGEAAIREFAQDASYITDDSVLLARCITVVERHAKTRGAGVWIAEGAEYRAAGSTFSTAPVVDENDPAVVAMRARRVSVHVRDCDSALPGVLAFPMIVRGELLGILVCGAKIDDETYAPDEQDALASLAAGVGHALDSIEVRELRRRLEALTATGGGRAAF
ncbi:MAG TPA: PDZ domain-containing protein [Candidatus Baltobacteraceae bacterium]|nr:PDZ domain-containing protein [Candidatus Baltobacteraceae bacterium]